jgi:hypothetical protein
VKSGAQLDERRNAPVYRDAPVIGARDAGDALEQRGLAGTVAADDTVGAAFRERGIDPSDFTIKNTIERLNDKGDIFSSLLDTSTDMQNAVEKLEAEED